MPRMKLVPVILSGGAGTRLWPLSRELLPKQLLALTGERTMLQETAARLAGFPDVTGPVVVCNEAHRFLVAEQLREMELAPTAILLEPVGRNTAPAIALAAHAALAAPGEDALLLVLPADHVLARPRRVPGRHPAGRARGARRGSWWPSASWRARRRPATATSVARRRRSGPGHAHRAIRREARSERARASSSPRATTSGTPACSCSARAASSTSSRASRPTSPTVCARASATAVRDTDFTRVDGAIFCRLPQRFGRLRGHGKDPRRGHGAARRRLERRRFLGRAARRAARRRARQRGARRRAARGHHRLLRARRQPAGRGTGLA